MAHALNLQRPAAAPCHKETRGQRQHAPPSRSLVRRPGAAPGPGSARSLHFDQTEMAGSGWYTLEGTKESINSSFHCDLIYIFLQIVQAKFLPYLEINSIIWRYRLAVARGRGGLGLGQPCYMLALYALRMLLLSFLGSPSPLIQGLLSEKKAAEMALVYFWNWLAMCDLF